MKKLCQEPVKPTGLGLLRALSWHSWQSSLFIQELPLSWEVSVEACWSWKCIVEDLAQFFISWFIVENLHKVIEKKI